MAIKRGDGRIRTAVGGFADLYLATRSRHRLVVFGSAKVSSGVGPGKVSGTKKAPARAPRLFSFAEAAKR